MLAYDYPKYIALFTHLPLQIFEDSLAKHVTHDTHAQQCMLSSHLQPCLHGHNWNARNGAQEFESNRNGHITESVILVQEHT